MKMARWYISVATLATMLLVAGCGGGDTTTTSSGTSSSPTPTPAPAPAPAPTPTPAPINYPLTVTVTGPGTVSSNIAAINGCSNTCSASLVSGQNVTLGAAPNSNSSFSTWGLGCTGNSASCAFTMTGTRNVTATFTTNPSGTGYLANTQFANALIDDSFTVNNYLQNSDQIVTIDRVWDADTNRFANRNIFHPYCNDNYFGVRRMVSWPAAANRVFVLFTVKFGDAVHPYTWQTAAAPGCSGTTEARGHELKFPDIGSGPDRMIGKFQNFNWGLYLVRGVVNGQDPHSHPWTGLTFSSNQVRTIQFMIEDNGTSGDIVRMWYDNNQDFNAPDYNYVSVADLVSMNSLRGQSVRFDYGYRNHNVAQDQYFYVYDLRVSEQFIAR